MRAVIFDMDGVLADTNPFHRAAWERLCAREGRRIAPRELETRVFGWSTEDAIRNLWGRSLSQARIRRLAATKERLYRGAVAPRLRPVAGLKTLLAWLDQEGVPMALASSAAAENVALVLRTLGVGAAFRVRVLGRDVARAKPDPAIFLAASRRLCLPPRRCIVIEDSLSGVTAARRAGMRCVGVMTTHAARELRAHGADPVARDFRSVRLRRWLSHALAVAKPRAIGQVTASTWGRRRKTGRK